MTRPEPPTIQYERTSEAWELRRAPWTDVGLSRAVRGRQAGYVAAQRLERRIRAAEQADGDGRIGDQVERIAELLGVPRRPGRDRLQPRQVGCRRSARAATMPAVLGAQRGQPVADVVDQRVDRRLRRRRPAARPARASPSPGSCRRHPATARSPRPSAARCWRRRPTCPRSRSRPARSTRQSRLRRRDRQRGRPGPSPTAAGRGTSGWRMRPKERNMLDQRV